MLQFLMMERGIWSRAGDSAKVARTLVESRARVEWLFADTNDESRKHWPTSCVFRRSDVTKKLADSASIVGEMHVHSEADCIRKLLIPNRFAERGEFP